MAAGVAMRGAQRVAAVTVATLALASACAERLPDNVASKESKPEVTNTASDRTAGPTRSAAPRPTRTSASPPPRVDPTDAYPECSLDHVKFGLSTSWSGEQAVQTFVATPVGKEACRIDGYLPLAALDTHGNEVPIQIDDQGAPGRVVVPENEDRTETLVFTLSWSAAAAGATCDEPVDLDAWRVTPASGKPVTLPTGLRPEEMPCGYRMIRTPPTRS